MQDKTFNQFQSNHWTGTTLNKQQDLGQKLGMDLKMHTGEKSNKCSQCDFASSEADHLKRHFITHSGEKSNKCNQCSYASSNAGSLRAHLKTHRG